MLTERGVGGSVTQPQRGLVMALWRRLKGGQERKPEQKDAKCSKYAMNDRLLCRHTVSRAKHTSGRRESQSPLQLAYPIGVIIVTLLDQGSLLKN